MRVSKVEGSTQFQTVILIAAVALPALGVFSSFGASIRTALVGATEAAAFEPSVGAVAQAGITSAARALAKVDEWTPHTLEIDGKPYRRVGSVENVDFGSVPIDRQSGRSATVSFDVPEDAKGLSILIHGDAQPAYAYVYRLVDPTGRELISPHPDVEPGLISKVGRGQLVSPNGTYFEVFKQISTTAVPANGKVEIVPGRWQLEVALESPLPEGADHLARQVEVVMKRVPGDTSADVGVLPIAFRATADSILLGAQLESQMSEVVSFFRKAGIHLRIRDKGALLAQYGEQLAFDPALGGAPNAQFNELMRWPSERGVLNLFSLPEKNVAGGEVGIAPFGGAAAAHSLRPDVYGRAVVVADSRTPAVTAAHEIGHALGLLHTNLDSLSDTASWNHQLYGNELEARGLATSDAPNLMQVQNGPLMLTQEQMDVARRSAGIVEYRPE